MTDHVRERISAAEYFALPETTQPTQLIDGEIIEMPSPTPEHQDIVLEIAYFLKTLAKGRGWRVFVAPLDVEFDEFNAPQPDVIVVMPGSQCRVTDSRLIGAPDLIAEVLSPGTEKNDRSGKFRLYEKHGVREYWLVDPEPRLVEVWTLQGERFTRLDVFGTDERFASPLLGEIAVSDLFAS
jgi:Uma2 family endonuclease